MLLLLGADLGDRQAAPLERALVDVPLADRPAEHVAQRGHPVLDADLSAADAGQWQTAGVPALGPGALAQFPSLREESAPGVPHRLDVGLGDGGDRLLLEPDRAPLGCGYLGRADDARAVGHGVPRPRSDPSHSRAAC